MAGPTQAFLDTNILYGNTTFDMILSLAQAPYLLVTPLWNEHVFAELGRHLPQRLSALAEKHEGEPLTPAQASEQARRRLRAMRAAFPEAMVAMPPLEEYPDSLTSDPDDKAIAVGAIAGRADVLVTQNVRHFDQTGIRAFHPLVVLKEDEFLREILLKDPETTRAALVDMCSRHRWPPRNLQELSGILDRMDELESFSTALKRYLEESYRRRMLQASVAHGSQGRDRLGRFMRIPQGHDSDLFDMDGYWGADGNGMG